METENNNAPAEVEEEVVEDHGTANKMEEDAGGVVKEEAEEVDDEVDEEFDPDVRVVVVALLKNLMSYAFREPVDPDLLGVPDYLEKISKPMDLSTVLKKLDNRDYKRTKEVFDDLDLIWNNCITYNGPDHYLSVYAKKLRAYADNLYRERKGEDVGQTDSNNLETRDPQHPEEKPNDDPLLSDSVVHDAVYHAMRTIVRLRTAQAFRAPGTTHSANKCNLEKLNFGMIFERVKQNDYYKTIADVKNDVDIVFDDCFSKYARGSHYYELARVSKVTADKRFDIAYRTVGASNPQALTFEHTTEDHVEPQAPRPEKSDSVPPEEKPRTGRHKRASHVDDLEESPLRSAKRSRSSGPDTFIYNAEVDTLPLKRDAVREAVELALRTVNRTKNAQPFRLYGDPKSADRCDLKLLNLGMIFERVKNGKKYKTVGDVRRDIEALYEDIFANYAKGESIREMGEGCKSLMDKRLQILYEGLGAPGGRKSSRSDTGTANLPKKPHSTMEEIDREIEQELERADKLPNKAGHAAQNEDVMTEDEDDGDIGTSPLTTANGRSPGRKNKTSFHDNVAVPKPTGMSAGIARAPIDLSDLVFNRCIDRDLVSASWICHVKSPFERVRVVSFNDSRLIPNLFGSQQSTTIDDQERLEGEFRRLVSRLAGVKHELLLPYKDSITIPGYPFCVVTERPRGNFASLESLIRNPSDEREFTLQEAIVIGHQVATALDHLHSAGLVHGSCRASNILVDPSELTVLMINYGLPLLRPAALEGSPFTPDDYECLAPELLESPKASGEADVFALGIFLHELLTHRRVVSGRSALQILAEIARTPELVPFTDEDSEVPEDLRRVVTRCLSRDPAARPRASEVLDVLKQVEDRIQVRQPEAT